MINTGSNLNAQLQVSAFRNICKTHYYLAAKMITMKATYTEKVLQPH